MLAAAEAFGDPRLGDGLDRLLASYGAPAITAAQIAWLAQTGTVPDLDRAAASLSDADIVSFAAKSRISVEASDADSLNKLIAGG